MTHTKLVLSSLSLAFVALLGSGAGADPKPAGPPPAAAATLKEIEQMVGFVPAFVHAIAPTLLPSWWQMAKDLEMNPTTALDGKTKELIGLAVAAQIPCEYCIDYHTEAARMAGATDQQIQEAVGMAAVTRANSALLNGLRIDRAQYKKDLERLMSGAHHAKK